MIHPQAGAMFTCHPAYVIGFRAGTSRALRCSVLALCIFLGGRLLESDLKAAPSLHEQLLSVDAGLKAADKVHTYAYNSVRSRLSDSDKQTLKDDQLRWLSDLNQALAQAQVNLRRNLVLQWTMERTGYLNSLASPLRVRATDSRGGGAPRENPANVVPNDFKVEQGSYSASSELAPFSGMSVSSKNASDNNLLTWWSPSKPDRSGCWLQVSYLGYRNINCIRIHAGSHYPNFKGYGNLFTQNYRIRSARLQFSDGFEELVELGDFDEIQQVIFRPHLTTYIRIIPTGYYPSQRWDDPCISYFAAGAIGTESRQPATKAQVPEPVEVKPAFSPIATQTVQIKPDTEESEISQQQKALSLQKEAQQQKGLSLQREAYRFFQEGDVQAAESRLHQAARECPTPAMETLASAFSTYSNLIQDKALRSVDGDWKKPTLPSSSSFGSASKQAMRLRSFGTTDIAPVMCDLALGLEAAGLLAKFSSDYEAAGDRDLPHPIRALRSMKQSERYREVMQDSSDFTKPFRKKIDSLEELIGSSAREYDGFLTRASELQTSRKYLEAASQLRQALKIENSNELERDIYQCESKASGL